MKAKIFFFLVLFFSIPFLSSAHENYVLTKQQIDSDLIYKGPGVLSALNNAGNVRVALTVVLFSLIGVMLYFLFDHSKIGRSFDLLLQKLDRFGEIILRTALGLSLIASAHFNAFLGPEILLNTLPLAAVLKICLYILGVMMVLGLWSEVTGLLALVILLMATWVYKDYMLTYFNYLGEFLALLFFGSRIFSLDKLIYGARQAAGKWHDAELALIRITYGISVMYPAIIYKLIHPEVIIDIVNRYNLTQFHWLFPHDPLLISLGAGLAQVVVGLCLIFGFETRLNTLVTFVLMSMSVLFFKEAVWPHWILLALALYLMINNGGNWSLDYYIEKKWKKV